MKKLPHSTFSSDCGSHCAPRRTTTDPQEVAPAVEMSHQCGAAVVELPVDVVNRMERSMLHFLCLFANAYEA